MKASYWLTGAVWFFVTGHSAMAQPQGDAALGREKAVVCVSCHGNTGMSVGPNVPHLAGQRSEYFVNALKAYKNRSRTDPVAVLMYPFSDKLSTQDMWDLAAFYEALAPHSLPAGSAEEEQ